MRPTICLLFIFFAVAANCQPAFTSSNLPIVVINTLGNTIADDPKVAAHMGIIYNGTGVRNLLTDPLNNYYGNIGIEYRGQSSQNFPMKSYGIELRDAANASQEKSLLGIPKESDWVLYAPYTDKTLMRNVLAYTLSSRMGHWAAQCRYVELVIDNEYRGIYVLMEKIKRGSNRVNISKIGASDNSGDAVTGGYIVSLDKDPPAFLSKYPPIHSLSKEIRFSNVYPKPDKITISQNDYIKAYIDSFETALNGPAYQDPLTGVRKYANLPSFIDYFLVNEISHNVDGYRLSTFMYKDKFSLGGKLNMGPVWDYDLAFRNANYCDGSSTISWAYLFNSTCPLDYYQVPFWWEKLMTDTAFLGALKCRYSSLRQTILSTSSINTTIDSIQQLLAEAGPRHFAKWPILGQYVWPNQSPIPVTYAGEIATLKSWIKERNAWLEYNIPDAGACGRVINRNGFSLIPAPNPLSSTGTVMLVSDKQQALIIIVYNSAGQTCYTGALQVNIGVNYLRSLPLNRWQNGLYIVNAYSQAGEKTSAKFLLVQ